MRFLKALLSLAAICAAFLLSYVGTRLSLHRDLLPRGASMPEMAVTEPARTAIAGARLPSVPPMGEEEDLQPTGATNAPSRILQSATARMHEEILANVDARRGALIRFGDGSYLAIAPRLLSRDTAVTAALSAPVTAETTAFVTVGSAMMLTFRPVVDGLAYADPAPASTTEAVAAIAETNRARLHLTGRTTIFVKRVFLADGTSTTFEERPSGIAPIMSANLAADHVLTFTARYRGTILISLERSR